ncbi:peptidase domain-containing ABC transporter [Sphingomonas sp. H39-1-10]|uniref:peptidase domain-containing ABC transporter n=1 Tax=Sphingomonas pollutisoli TaxID=3030829 RepID=UPI0023B8F972|nr:peptidase domain-containing ABC transporter [Sphingomonas pollutisoli]MDF0490152.1 peptidase domain-containing ABC transporter [Sphingomonas pollutisoli]
MSAPSLRNLQSEAAECGLACLAMAANMVGSEIDLAWLRQHFPSSIRGMNLRQMGDVAHSIGMTARAVRCEPDELQKLQTPAVLHWGLHHFVVLQRARGSRIRIFDPSRGYRNVRAEEVNLCFTGVALELAASPSFQRQAERPPFSPFSLIRWSREVKSGLIQAMLLSFVLQVYMIAAPLYMQTAIDGGALRGDKGLLITLAIGFACFALFNAGAQALRAIVLQRLSAVLSWDMSRRLFHHLIRLPLPWFERRKLADTMTRFQAIEPIKTLITTGLVGSMLDGFLSISMLALMFVYSPSLAAVALTGFLLYLIVRVATIRLTVSYAAEAFRASISEQGKRMETLRSIQTIKIMSGESQRESVWANKQAALVKAQQGNTLVTSLIGVFQQLIETSTIILIVYLAASEIIEGRFSVGALYAFVSYRQQFSTKISGMVDQMISWRLLDVYNTRIADVVLTPIEHGIESEPNSLPELRGNLEVASAAFRYGPGEPVIFKDVSFTIEAGESVAIVGRSGCGKSTLLKVICGLYPLTAGEIGVDGLPLSVWGPRAIRSAFGVVMQNDDLLPGSVLENVGFFDEEIDVDRAWECLRQAAVADEIRRLPMAEHSYVGDIGSALSGGQRQRILLARALYKKPRFLVLDEATAHLDGERESRINEYLRSLAITRLVVAHRLETISAADRVLLLTPEGVVELGSGAEYRANAELHATMRVVQG